MTVRNVGGQEARFVRDTTTGAYVPVSGVIGKTEAHESGHYRLTTSDQTQVFFAADGQPLSILDRNGRGITLTYDDAGHLVTISPTSGHATHVVRNAEHLVENIVRPDGGVLSFHYGGPVLFAFADAIDRVTRLEGNLAGFCASSLVGCTSLPVGLDGCQGWRG